MTETLIQRLDRIESELKLLKSIKPPKQIDYSEGISLLERVNEELNKRFSDLHKKYYELSKELLTVKNKKPVEQLNYSDDISALKNELSRLDSKGSKPISLPFVNIDEFKAKAKAEGVEKNKITERLKTLENKKETKQRDYSTEIKNINLAVERVKATVADNKIDIKKEIEKHVNESYITNLYRNK